MTTFATCLTASLLSVTFGWVPSEPARKGAEPDGYDYLVQVSPVDLDALRAGDAPSLVSELPTDVGPIRRVRIYVGEGEAPRRLVAADQTSPKSLAAVDAERRVVAKPVVPDWPDAARLVGDSTPDDASPTAERRTVYQNPADPLDLRRLSDGFREGARALAEGTEKIVEDSGAGLERGARGLLDGASRLLEGELPGGANPYGNRPPQYAPAPVAPRELTQPAQFEQRDGVAEFSPPATAQAPAFRPEDYRGAAAAPDPYAPAAPPLGGAPLGGSSSREYEDRGAAPSGGLAEPFAAGQQDLRRSRPTVPVPRGTARPAAADTTESPWDAFDRAGDNGSQRDPYDRSAPPADSGFPVLRQPQTDAATARANERDFAREGDFSPPATRTAATSGPDTGWRDRSLGAEAPTANDFGDAPSAARSRGEGSRYVEFEKLLLVVFGAATCFTWIAYIDVRNKYRSVLRTTPGGAYSPAA